MITTFDRAMAYLWRDDVEGGHADRPAHEDPGGDTWYGLARRWHADMPWPPTREQAMERFRTHYWLAASCDKLPYPLALATFDAAVMHDPAEAKKLLQRALGVVPDGIVGPVTVAAAERCDLIPTMDAFLGARIVKMASLSNWPYNKNGWVRRMFILYRTALAAALARQT